MFGDEMKHDDPIVEARARIIWGEEVSSVRSFLTSKGMSTAQADVMLKEFYAERNAEIRRRGLRNILVGVALIAAAGVLLSLVLAGIDLPVEGYGILVLAALYGSWKLVSGIVALFKPQSEHESISNISP